MPRITRADGSVYTTMVHNPRRRTTAEGPTPKAMKELVQDIIDLSAKLADDTAVPELGTDWFADLTKFRDMLKSQAGPDAGSDPASAPTDGPIDVTPAGLAAMSQRLGRTFPAGTQFRTCGNAIVASVPRGLNGKGGWGFERYEPTTGGGYRRS